MFATALVRWGALGNGCWRDVWCPGKRRRPRPSPDPSRLREGRGGGKRTARQSPLPQAGGGWGRGGARFSVLTLVGYGRFGCGIWGKSMRPMPSPSPSRLREGRGGGQAHGQAKPPPAGGRGFGGGEALGFFVLTLVGCGRFGCGILRKSMRPMPSPDPSRLREGRGGGASTRPDKAPSRRREGVGGGLALGFHSRRWLLPRLRGARSTLPCPH